MVNWRYVALRPRSLSYYSHAMPRVEYDEMDRHYHQVLRVWEDKEAVVPPKRHWWQKPLLPMGPDWEVEVPLSLHSAARALSGCSGPAEPLAQAALYEMAADCKRFADFGSTGSMEYDAGRRWDQVVADLHRQFVAGNNPGADKIAMVLKNLAELPGQNLTQVDT